MKHYTKKEMLTISISWHVMAFGRKLMKLGLNRIGSTIVEFGLTIGRDIN